MRFHCAHCKGLIEIQIPPGHAGPMPAACATCGHRHRITVNRPRATLETGRYSRAREYAGANRIDLASAYSVLEGILTLEQARALGGVRPSPGGPPIATASGPSGTPVSGPRADPGGAPRPGAAPGPGRPPAAGAGAPALDEVDYDPAFKDAVRDGTLSAEEAARRGERRALAARLGQRHRLPRDLAVQVADNRITLHEALSRKATRENEEPGASRASVWRGVWDFAVFSVGGLILVGLGMHIFNQWGEFMAGRDGSVLGLKSALAASPSPRRVPAESTAPAPPPALTVPAIDATGQTVGVEGPDPASVLIVFCGSGRRGGLREPVAIAPAVPASAALRFGVFRNADLPDAPPRAIRIRRDPRTGRWHTGDGRAPVPTEPPPVQPPGARTVPVSRSAQGVLGPGDAPEPAAPAEPRVSS